MIAKSVACLGTLIILYIRIGSGHFGDSSIRMGFQKNDFFLGMNVLWIFFGGHHKIGLVLGSFLCILGSASSQVSYRILERGCFSTSLFAENENTEIEGI